MKTVCAAGKYVRGIDVSHWQNRVDFSLVQKSGLKFAFLKATEGLTVLDKTFQEFRKQCQSIGLPVGAYHFFHPKYDPIQQADFFLKTIGGLIGDDVGELPPVLDFETMDSVSAAKGLSAGLAFLEHVEAKIGRLPIVYGSPYFLEALGDKSGKLKKYPLWIAHYGPNCPLVPAPWDNWLFWQFSDKWNAAGIAGKCDINNFNGDEDALKKFCGKQLPDDQNQCNIKLEEEKASAKKPKKGEKNV